MTEPITDELTPADFDFALPAELIAQQPAHARDASRLLVLDRATRRLAHRRFTDLPEFLAPGDALIFNDSRVIPARLWGRKAGTGGEIEMLLVEENSANDWWVMLRPGKRVRAGTQIQLVDSLSAPTGISAEVREKNPEGHCRLQF